MSEPTQEKPEKKKFTERLRDIFRRKAKPAPVPAAIYNDKRVQKAVIKSRRRRFLKRFLMTSVAAAAISAGTHYAPDTVSTPFNQFMYEQGHAADLKTHFHAQNTRVYDRWNPLYPFHLAGQGVKITWQEIDGNEQSGAFSKGFDKANHDADCLLQPAVQRRDGFDFPASHRRVFSGEQRPACGA